MPTTLNFPCKLTSLFVSSLIFAVLTFSTSISAAEEIQIKGFLGLEWGDSVDKLGSPEALLLSKSSRADNSCFSRKEENLFLNKIPLRAIYYCFFKGKFASVVIYSSQPNSFKLVRAALYSAFGEPNVEVAQYVSWSDESEDTGGSIGMFEGKRGVASIAFRSNALSKEQEASDKLKAIRSL
jgi:hypothetical protein